MSFPFNSGVETQVSRRPTVLVIDDNRETNKLICDSLAAEYRVESAYDGREGLDKALGIRPDLILTDLMMPEMGGEDLVRALRACPDLDKTPIVLVTAQADDAVRVHLLQNGAQDCLTKPFKIDELRARVANLVTVKRLREAEASETSYRHLAELIPQLVFTARPDGHWDYLNERWVKYTGLTIEQSQGWGWSRALYPEDLQQCLDLWHRALQTGEAFETECRFRRASDGTWRWHLARALPLNDTQDRIVKWFGSCTDIEDQKKAQEERAQLLRREQAARAEAEAANQAKDEFLAMLGHELRNPLVPIRNAAQVLRLVGPKEPTFEKMRDMIDRQVSHMARLIDDLLDVSRITRGKVLLRKEPLDLVELVKSTIEDNRAALTTAGLQVTVQLPDGPLWMMGDCTRLAQVLGNVLDNAKKFTETGGQVFVRLKGEDGTASLSVRDTGVGMTGEMLARLFESFSQADRSLDRPKGGLGLGLVLMKGLVDLHGGSVEARSEGLGRGTEFTIRLPLQPDAGTRVAPETHASVQPETARPKCRVLLVEDNVDSAESLLDLLVLSGHEVAVARTGIAGIETAREFRPEVVLCDIGLPGEMDGYKVAQVLRREPLTAEAYLIAFTGYGQQRDLVQAREAGFDLHLTKPVHPASLQQLLADLPHRA